MLCQRIGTRQSSPSLKWGEEGGAERSGAERREGEGRGGEGREGERMPLHHAARMAEAVVGLAGGREAMSAAAGGRRLRGLPVEGVWARVCIQSG